LRITCRHDVAGALPGTSLITFSKDDDKETVKKSVFGDLNFIYEKLSPAGVYIQASTLGTLEAMLDFFRGAKIPVSGFGLGTLEKRDVMKVYPTYSGTHSSSPLLCFRREKSMAWFLLLELRSLQTLNLLQQ